MDSREKGVCVPLFDEPPEIGHVVQTPLLDVAEEVIHPSRLLSLPVDLLQTLSSCGKRVLQLEKLLEPHVQGAARGEASGPTPGVASYQTGPQLSSLDHDLTPFRALL